MWDVLISLAFINDVFAELSRTKSLLQVYSENYCDFQRFLNKNVILIADAIIDVFAELFRRKCLRTLLDVYS